MSGEQAMEPAKINAARDKVAAALAGASEMSPAAVDALEASLAVLETFAVKPLPAAAASAPFINYTLEDSGPAARREFDLRISYDWTDYDPADEPSPLWGAHIEDVQVTAVRYYDRDGNEIDWQTHAGLMAWDLLEQEHDRVLEACTNDGALRGLGRTHPLYTPTPVKPIVETGNAPRMAPSMRSRTMQLKPRFFG